MGFGMPSAIGAAMARPKDTIIAIVGDGGYQMTCCELATAAIWKVPIKVFIFNNRYLGMVRQWQDLFFENVLSGVDLEGNPDFVKHAESYGIKALRIDNEKRIDEVIGEALAYNAGPVVVEVVTQREDNVFPMIPPGMSLHDIIIEPPDRKTLQKPTGST